MKKLLLVTITLVLMLCVQNPSSATDVRTVKATIVKHAIELGVDPALALSIARTESGFRHSARSCHGAVGVFQLMPSTARRMGLNPYSLNDNVKGGILYYKRMYKMFGSTELALAAYNAGPAKVKKYRKVPPYRETKRFVKKIMTDYNHQKSHPEPVLAAAKKKHVATKTVTVKKNQIVKVAPVPTKVETSVQEASAIKAEVIEQSADVSVPTESVAAI
ncbi:MAG: lytic transglycosylase domain-containing protein [Clostridiaceae bacterium]|nr:lytic transglycosylase domain-containing protein [Clostridiaceae bacterium]